MTHKAAAYRFETLSPGAGVYTSKEHGFGTDAFLLADFAAPRRKDTVCDLGTGCGIIPMIWQRESPPRFCWGVDIQPQAVRQFALSIERCGLGGRLLAVLADLCQLKGVLPFGAFDLVTCNPPYKAPQAGIISALPADKVARHETLCTIEDVCRAAGSLLQFGGRLCLCQRPERLADVIAAMRAVDIEPKRLRFVQKQADTAPWLFLIEGKKGARPCLRALPPRLVHRPAGGYSAELLRIMGKEGE